MPVPPRRCCQTWMDRPQQPPPQRVPYNRLLPWQEPRPYNPPVGPQRVRVHPQSQWDIRPEELATAQREIFPATPTPAPPNRARARPPSQWDVGPEGMVTTQGGASQASPLPDHSTRVPLALPLPPPLSERKGSHRLLPTDSPTHPRLGEASSSSFAPLRSPPTYSEVYGPFFESSPVGTRI
jgi:hypothetical protein